MRHSNLAVSEIIVRILHESAECKDKLEVEASGRVVAKLQGSVSGYRIFISFLAAEFGINQISLEYNGEEGFKTADLSDSQLLNYRLDIQLLKDSEEWKNVLERIRSNAEQLKNYLLFNAEKTRDLDYSQGQYLATVFYESFFNAIQDETSRREAEQEERRNSPGLFDDEIEAAQSQEGYHSK